MPISLPRVMYSVLYMNKVLIHYIDNILYWQLAFSGEVHINEAARLLVRIFYKYPQARTGEKLLYLVGCLCTHSGNCIDFKNHVSREHGFWFFYTHFIKFGLTTIYTGSRTYGLGFSHIAGIDFC